MVKAWTDCYLARCLSHLQPAAKLYFRGSGGWMAWPRRGHPIPALTDNWSCGAASRRSIATSSCTGLHPAGSTGIKLGGPTISAICRSRASKSAFPWERTFSGRQKNFFFLYRYCLWLAVRNVRDIIAAEIFQWTSLSEFGQDNGLTRNTGARWKLKGPTDFYRSQYLKINFNPWVNYCSFFIPWRLGGWVGK